MNCEFARLPDEALLHISGPDTMTFLQGQTTCDTRALDDAEAYISDQIDILREMVEKKKVIKKE